MSSTLRSLRWRTVGEGGGTVGLEHVELKIGDSQIAAEGVAVAGPAEGPDEAGFGARWRMVVDAEWVCVRSLHLTRLGGPTLALRHDGYGGWSDGEGKPRKDLQGLLDCLIAGSPFGTTALVKRLGDKAKKPQTLEVIAVSLPGLEASRTSLALKPLDGASRIAVTLGETTFEVAFDEEGAPTAFGERISRA